MSYVLVPGAGGRGWFWHLVAAELRRRGHRVRAVDLPGADPAAGLAVYRDLIADAVRDLGAGDSGTGVTVAALSLGGFSAPLACGPTHVDRLVLVNAMIPAPGETAGDWRGNVGWEKAARAAAESDGHPMVDPGDLETTFLHDVPPSVSASMRAESPAEFWTESPAAFEDPWPLPRWPDVPTEVFAGRDDRLFPPALQRDIAASRLGLPVTELPGGHLLPLSQPTALTDALTR